jgi:hypothetical protein
MMDFLSITFDGQRRKNRLPLCSTVATLKARPYLSIKISAYPFQHKWGSARSNQTYIIDMGPNNDIAHVIPATEIRTAADVEFSKVAPILMNKFSKRIQSYPLVNYNQEHKVDLAVNSKLHVLHQSVYQKRVRELLKEAGYENVRIDIKRGFWNKNELDFPIWARLEDDQLFVYTLLVFPWLIDLVCSPVAIPMWIVNKRRQKKGKQNVTIHVTVPVNEKQSEKPACC